MTRTTVTAVGVTLAAAATSVALVSGRMLSTSDVRVALRHQV